MVFFYFSTLFLCVYILTIVLLFVNFSLLAVFLHGEESAFISDLLYVLQTECMRFIFFSLHSYIFNHMYW